MGTRSNIFLKEGEKLTGIYCHWDGYPDGVGLTLHEHYTEPNKIKELISLGSISSLRERVAPAEGEQHSYKKPLDDVTIAYHRDRGEEMEEPLTELPLDSSDIEYTYVFDGHMWTCNGKDLRTVLKKLKLTPK